MVWRSNWRHYWHDFSHPVITNAGDNREFIDVTEGELGIPSDAQKAAEKIENYNSPDRQRGKRGSSAVIITPDRQQMPLRRRYGGPRSRRGYHGNIAARRAGASNAIIYRKRGKRRRRRRKLRWGTRVRRSALGLFEGKRYVTPVAVQNDVAKDDVQRIALLPGLIQNTDKDTHDDVPGLVDVSQPLGVASIQTSKVTGLQMMIRGCKFNITVKNDSTVPIVVRFICGWRRTFADMGGTAMGTNALHIFRNTDNNTRMVPLNLTAAAQRGAVWRNITAPIDKTAFHVEKDFTFYMGPKPATAEGSEAETLHGNNFKSISFWWEMYNKRMNFISDLLPGDSALDKENKMTWYPVVMFYHTNPENAGIAVADYSYDFCVYYKDPRG